MKKLLVFVVIICIAFLLNVGAQNEDIKSEVTQEETLAEPVALPVTRLKITLIDELSDQFLKLENCVVQVLGELHIAEDSFNYSNTFVEGDRYEITIHIKLKK